MEVLTDVNVGNATIKAITPLTAQRTNFDTP